MLRIPRSLVLLATLALVAACEGGPLLPSVVPSSAPPTDLGSGADVVIGVSLPGPDPDPFLLSILAAAQARADELGSIQLHLEDAKGKADTQLEEVEAMLEAGVDALIVVPVDSSATEAIRDLAKAADVPLVWLQRRPYDLAGDGSTPFVGTDGLQAGTLEMQALADELDGRGSVAILMGDPATEPAVLRTEGCKDVIATYPGLRLVREQAAGGDRERAHDVVAAWLEDETLAIDAICANDDERALGAIQALDEAGRLDGVAIGGVDGTDEALDAIREERLTYTVFQDAAGQGRTAVETVVAMARGGSVETVEGAILLPGELVTRDNVDAFAGRNPKPAPGE